MKIDLHDRLVKIKVLVFDIDGVLTDGKIYLSGDEEETKCFYAKDAPRIAIALRSGLSVVFLTARRCQAVERRARELKTVLIYKQELKEKGVKLMDELKVRFGTQPEEIFYTGDDWSDLYLMKQSGACATPADGSPENKEIADVVAECKGGEGVAAEIVETVMRAQNIWDKYSTEYKSELIY